MHVPYWGKVLGAGHRRDAAMTPHKKESSRKDGRRRKIVVRFRRIKPSSPVFLDKSRSMDSSRAMHAGAGGFFFWNDNPQHFSLSVGPTLRLTPTGRSSSSLKRGEAHRESSGEPFTFSTCVRGTCTHEATDCPSVSIMFTIRTTISNKTVGSATNESFRSSGEPTTHVKQIQPPQQNLAPPVVK